MQQPLPVSSPRVITHKVLPGAFKFNQYFLTIRCMRTPILGLIGLKLASSRWALLGGFLEFGCLLRATIPLNESEPQGPARSLRSITIVVLHAMHGFCRLVDVVGEWERGSLSLIL